MVVSNVDVAAYMKMSVFTYISRWQMWLLACRHWNRRHWNLHEDVSLQLQQGMMHMVTGMQTLEPTWGCQPSTTAADDAHGHWHADVGTYMRMSAFNYSSRWCIWSLACRRWNLHEDVSLQLQKQMMHMVVGMQTLEPTWGCQSSTVSADDTMGCCEHVADGNCQKL